MQLTQFESWLPWHLVQAEFQGNTYLTLVDADVWQRMLEQSVETDP